MRLDAIQPATVARAAQELLGGRFGAKLDGDVRALVVFAQRGVPEAPAARVTHALFMPPSAPVTGWMRARLALPEGDLLDTPRGQLLTVVLAARGRMRLREGCIDVAELAALASCGTRNIRFAAGARGELDRAIDAGRFAPITAKTAIRFLAARGVRPWSRA